MKACESTCISHLLILANAQFAKTKLLNLAKGVIIAEFSLSPCSAQASLSTLHPAWSSSSTSSPSFHHFPQTYCKSPLPLLCLPQIFHFPGMPINLWSNITPVTQFFQVFSTVQGKTMAKHLLWLHTVLLLYLLYWCNCSLFGASKDPVFAPVTFEAHVHPEAAQWNDPGFAAIVVSLAWYMSLWPEI